MVIFLVSFFLPSIQSFVRLLRRQIETTVTALARKLEGLRDGMEACQDYIAVRGLRLWHQEFAAVVR